MKIIKQPEYNIIKCKICGTVFQPEAGDDIQYHHFNNGGFYGIFARCPNCGTLCEATDKTDKKGYPETCVSCGEVIPEGRQVCPICQKGSADERAD